MKPAIPVIATVIVLTMFGTAWAGRCADIPNTRIVWCDDFDNYCTANNPTNPWPGYPPTPDTICPTDQSGTPDQAFFCAHWSNVNYPPGCDCSYYHPGDPNCYPEQGPDRIDETPNSLEVVENTSLGRPPANMPHMLMLQRFGASQYHEFDMSSAISARHPGNNAVNGSDESPLKVKLYFSNASSGGSSFMINRDPLYFELRLGDDRAPTDYVWSPSRGSPPWCNCYSSNSDATCGTGTCQQHACEGTCNFNLCLGGTCLSGPKVGQTCSNHSQCSECVGGPIPGSPCANNYACSGCASGPLQGQQCSTALDCGPGTCSDGPKTGQECSTNANCSACIGGALAGTTCSSNSDCQLACGPEQQATCVDGFGAMIGQPCSQHSDCGGEWKYPVVVQQSFHATRIPTPHPQPPWTVHASLAVGYLAQLDNGATYGYPAVEHLCIFDGEKWNDIRANQYANQVGDFGGPNEYAWVTMDIKTSTFDLKMWDTKNPNDFPNSPTSSATIPRQYTGPFNTIAIGAGASCELNAVSSNDWSCKNGAQRAPWERPYPKDRVYSTSGTIGGVSWGRHIWQAGWIDTPVIWDGEYLSLSGACCLNDATCQDLTSMACLQAGGRFQGYNTTCAATTCCPYPFADSDHDGDVDQDDFGAFQICYNGAEAVPTGCDCFDRNTDGKVDTTDFEALSNCWTGPNVPWSQGLTPSCVP